MDISALAALVLGIVEGLTEFLPVSSTGHLILASSALGLTGPKVLAFEIIIQGAAILAVCWEYRRLLWHTTASLATDPDSRRFALNVLLGFLPLALLGLAFQETIEAKLFRPVPVAIALVIGGIAILIVDRRASRATLDAVAAELARGQGNGVHHDQPHGLPGGTLIAIGGRDAPNAGQPAFDVELAIHSAQAAPYGNAGNGR